MDTVSTQQTAKEVAQGSASSAPGRFIPKRRPTLPQAMALAALLLAAACSPLATVRRVSEPQPRPVIVPNGGQDGHAG